MTDIVLVHSSRPDLLRIQVAAIEKFFRGEYFITVVERAMCQMEQVMILSECERLNIGVIPAEQTTLIRHDCRGFGAFHKELEPWMNQIAEHADVLYIEHDVWPVEHTSMDELCDEYQGAASFYGGIVWPNFIALREGQTVPIERECDHLKKWIPSFDTGEFRVGPFFHYDKAGNRAADTSARDDEIWDMVKSWGFGIDRLNRLPISGVKSRRIDDPRVGTPQRAKPATEVEHCPRCGSPMEGSCKRECKGCGLKLGCGE